MADIAKALNVAQSTVSRALRNDPQVSKKLTEKIVEKAQEMGYRPNPFVAACMAQVRGYRRKPTPATIAILDCAKDQKSMGYTQGQFIKGAKARAESLGFNTECFNMRDIEFSYSALNRILWTRSISGLLVLPVPYGHDLNEIKFEGLASATLDQSLQDPVLHRATSDYFHGMQTAYQKLWEKGYRRIAFCTHEEEIARIGERWLGGFYAEQAIKRADYIPHFCTTTWQPEEFKAWVDKHLPDVIVGNTPVYARWLIELGYNVPDEIAVASLYQDSGTLPGYSGISQKLDKIAEAGIDMIVAQINRNDYGLPSLPKSTSVKSSWVEGSSTPDKEGALENIKRI